MGSSENNSRIFRKFSSAKGHRYPKQVVSSPGGVVCVVATSESLRMATGPRSSGIEIRFFRLHQIQPISEASSECGRDEIKGNPRNQFSRAITIFLIPRSLISPSMRPASPIKQMPFSDETCL